MKSAASSLATSPVEIDRARDAQREIRRARRRSLADRLETVLCVVALALMVGVLGPSLDDETSTVIAMSMLSR